MSSIQRVTQLIAVKKINTVKIFTGTDKKRQQEAKGIQRTLHQMTLHTWHAAYTARAAID